MEPYTDDEGEYHEGHIAYHEIDGKYYVYNEPDGSVGEELSEDALTLSYFIFTENNLGGYTIEHYTGPTDSLTQLVFPKTYKGMPIKEIGRTDSDDFFYNATTGSVELVLNENIEQIGSYCFENTQVSKVSGDTSALEKIGDYAFYKVNKENGYKFDLNLDRSGPIDMPWSALFKLDVTVHLQHTASLTCANLYPGDQTIYDVTLTYDFTDDHIYGDPDWEWADDFSAATATFTCTDKRCNHQETVDAASVIKEHIDGKTVYTASVDFGDETYTGTKTLNYVTGHSLSLSDSIGVNFFFSLTEEQAASATVSFAWGNQEQNDVPVAIDPDSGRYAASCTVAADQINEVITATLSIYNIDCDTDKYSVKQYCDTILSDEYKTAYTGDDYDAIASDAAALADSVNHGYIIGDADGDGKVTITDATVIQKRLACLYVASFNDKAADINGDGLDIVDATLIQKYLASIDIPCHIGEQVTAPLPEARDFPFIANT